MAAAASRFPFLFGGTFIEGLPVDLTRPNVPTFPFLFGGTFIEGREFEPLDSPRPAISLPFRRDFH